MTRFGLGVLAYLLPTFALGFVWHLILFQGYYEALAMYRSDILVPLGFLSMVIQAVIFAWICDALCAKRAWSFGRRAGIYGLMGGVLSWSYTTLAVAAKNVMSSVPDYLLIETAFTVTQWIIVAPLTLLVLSPRRPRGG
jgi:hypothetical protein